MNPIHTILGLILAALILTGCPPPEPLPPPSVDSQTRPTDSGLDTDPGESTDDTGVPDEDGAQLFDSCEESTDCAEDYVCESITDGSPDRHCVGDLGTTCATDDSCASTYGYECVPEAPFSDTSICGPRSAAGGPCYEDDDCLNGLCGEASETCADGWGSECMLDSDCLEDGVCRLNEEGTRTCQLLGGMGDYCDQESDCDNGRECSVDGACLGLSSESGCWDDALCPEGTVCRDDGGVDACLEPAVDSGSACQEEPDCGDGLVCVDQVCLAEDGYECVDAEDCSGESVCYSGYCTAPVPEGSSCQDASGEADDAICEEGLICSGATLECVTPYTGVVGDECAADEECGVDDDDNTLLCNVYAEVCALPGPVIADFTASEIITASSSNDDWGDWACTDYPEVEVPDGYETWTFVDTVSHDTQGDDSADFIVVVDEAAEQVCGLAAGRPDGFLGIGYKNDNSSVSFHVNTVVYNPTLMEVSSHEYRASDCGDLPEDLPSGNAVSVPCQTSSEYYYPHTVEEGFESVGLVEVRGFVPGDRYGSFIHAVVNIAEMAISEDYVGVALERTMLFAASYDGLCGGWLSPVFNVVSWRAGLPAEARMGRYSVRQEGSDVTVDLADLGDNDGVRLSFFGIQSSNLDTDRIPDEQFWMYCGSFSEGGITCDLQPSDEYSAAFPYENEIEEILTKGAEEGGSKVCETVSMLNDFGVCDYVGMGIGKLTEIIFDALFPDPCGSGVDRDADWALEKTPSGEGWAYSYDATTGESNSNDNVSITVQIFDLNFDE
jgi:hypothetical protein